jgi:BMFP domain-containing protein YqiC
MSQTRTLDELVRRIAAVLPPGISQLNEDVRKNLKEVLSTYLARMDLVTREEFEVQSAVLARTREKLDHLEAQVATLENQAGETSGNSAGTADG